MTQFDLFGSVVFGATLIGGMHAVFPPIARGQFDPTVSESQLRSAAEKSTTKKKTPEPNATALRNVFVLEFDANRDGKLSESELPEELRRFFARTDRNHDGFLDAEELLHARNPLGQRARRMEDLRLGLQGKLKERKIAVDRRGVDLSWMAGEWLRRMDLNGDGVVDDAEMRAILEEPDLLPKDLSAEGKIAIPVPGRDRKPELRNATPESADPRSASAPQAAAKEKADAPVAESGQADAHFQSPPVNQGRGDRTSTRGPEAKESPDELTPDGLPTVNTILKHLDKNGNGCVDRDEAVDELRDHFNLLDRNKDGKLDRDELERSLKLARMFGKGRINKAGVRR